MSTIKRCIATIFLYVTLCSAVCCKNHNKLCFVNGIDCEPNCDDGMSRCDLTGQTCKNDSVGGCIDNVVKITTQTIFPPLTTVTSYTSTTTVYTTTSTALLTVTTGIEISTRVATVTNIHTAVASQVSIAPRRAARLPNVFARAVTSTVYATTTVTDADHCKSTDEPACTTTISTQSTLTGNGSAIITSAVGVVFTNIVNMTSTVDVTTTVAPAPTAAARQGSAATGGASSDATSLRAGKRSSDTLLLRTGAAVLSVWMALVVLS